MKLVLLFLNVKLGTVVNHRNTEITETVIFVKCRDFAKISNAVFLRFYKNILFLISIILA